MSQSQLEQVYVRSQNDADFRRALEENLDEALASYELTDEELALFAGIPGIGSTIDAIQERVKAFLADLGNAVQNAPSSNESMQPSTRGLSGNDEMR
ncbi:MAG: hypothetical protein AAF639_18420 [Chloroflexota bacterium]